LPVVLYNGEKNLKHVGLAKKKKSNISINKIEYKLKSKETCLT